MNDPINHPAHYTAFPQGFGAECIEYTRHMPFSQGNAFKYLYRAGSKGDMAEDLGKCAWYLRDAIEYNLYMSVAHLTPSIDPTRSTRSRIGHMIIHGQLNAALYTLSRADGRLEGERGTHE